jgi:hypothetical protein
VLVEVKEDGESTGITTSDVAGNPGFDPDNGEAFPTQPAMLLKIMMQARPITGKNTSFIFSKFLIQTSAIFW